jgi:septation ring formation regulator EzrA
MSVLKWSMESVWAATAVIITTAGGVYTTSYHWGQASQEIAELKSRSVVVESHIAKHDEQLDAIREQNSAMQQSLGDIKDTVHDIQHEVRTPARGNND